jgi:hypothetical protein
MIDALLDYEVATLVMEWPCRVVSSDDWNEEIDLVDQEPTAILVRRNDFNSYYEFAPSDDVLDASDVLERLHELGWNVEILIPSEGRATVRLNGRERAIRYSGSTYMQALCKAAVEAVS